MRKFCNKIIGILIFLLVIISCKKDINSSKLIKTDKELKTNKNDTIIINNGIYLLSPMLLHR